MPERNLTATRITLLELGDERRMVREGYELLDEKRMLLASEILGGLRRYRGLREEWLLALEAARAALAAAVRRHTASTRSSLIPPIAGPSSPCGSSRARCSA